MLPRNVMPKGKFADSAQTVDAEFHAWVLLWCAVNMFSALCRDGCALPSLPQAAGCCKVQVNIFAKNSMMR
jgi:hypothetical protein